MFNTSGIYDSAYKYNGNKVEDTIAFYPSLDGGYIGVGRVDEDNWRMLLMVDEAGTGSYLELNASTYDDEGKGTVRFKQTDAGPLEGEWQSVDKETGEISHDSWNLVHNIGNTAVNS